MFAAHSEGGAEVGQSDWAEVAAYVKLRDFAMVAIDEIEGAGEEGEEEYYDEEDDKKEADKEEDKESDGDAAGKDEY